MMAGFERLAEFFPGAGDALMLRFKRFLKACNRQNLHKPDARTIQLKFLNRLLLR
jgi:hypothetical protein